MMKVSLIAATTMLGLPHSIRGTAFAERAEDDLPTCTCCSVDIDTLGEFAGRACYQAWELKNPATADNKGYLANIISQGHFSVLEHASVTFYIEGVSRSLTHELVRHRHLSYSELSQRYVDMEHAQMVMPPALRDVHLGGVALADVRDFASEAYQELVESLTSDGLPRKQAREAARAVMPNATETKIVVSGNLRAWRDFLGKRWHVAADAEIRELAGEILRHLREIAPHSVQDIPEEPYGTVSGNERGEDT